MTATIVITDDHPLFRDALGQAVASRLSGSRVVETANLEELVALLGREPDVDLVLLDLNLPRRDGREVLAEIKSDPDLRRIPVVVLTTSSAEEDVLRSYDLHANAYITKPVDPEQLLSLLRVWLYR